jgi:hypothetical protein
MFSRAVAAASPQIPPLSTLSYVCTSRDAYAHSDAEEGADSEERSEILHEAGGKLQSGDDDEVDGERVLSTPAV